MLDALLFSLAIAVGLTPQLLPAIVTVSLSTGARRMAQKSVLVKRLVSIEDLGDADLLFTDKTGTLTEGEIRLREAVDAVRRGRRRRSSGSGSSAATCSFEHGGTPLGNTLDLAIWREPRTGCRGGGARDAHDAWRPLPFTFERRRTSVVLDDAGRRRLLCKGAAEEVLARCTPASAGARRRRSSACSTRATACSLSPRRAVAARDAYGESDERDLTLRGFLVFADPPKADAARVGRPAAHASASS